MLYLSCPSVQSTMLLSSAVSSKRCRLLVWPFIAEMYIHKSNDHVSVLITKDILSCQLRKKRKKRDKKPNNVYMKVK